MPDASSNPPPDNEPLNATVELLTRARAGDEKARDALFQRFLPIVKRWARYRLPASARGLAETDDLVQITLIRALSRIDQFEARREGAFLAYLRTILMNAVREEIRRARPDRYSQALEEAAGPAPRSELDRLIGRETMERYEIGLSRLEASTREAVLMRLEFGYSHADIAVALGKSSSDAARMTVARGLAALSEYLDAEQP